MISLRESVLFIGTQFSILYTSMYSPAEAAMFFFLIYTECTSGTMISLKIAGHYDISESTSL
jgi:hypothetical protein